MKRKLIITKQEGNIITSVIENDEIVELHISDTNEKYRLGNIYIGKVKKIVSNIQAAFIEIDKGIECYYDMTERGNKPIYVGEEFVVQISREAIKTKQPAVTRRISFTGKYSVLTVGDNRISFSSKIDKEKRDELKMFMEEYRSKEYGFILRTNAKEATENDIREEIQKLIKEYEHLIQISPTRVCFSCLKESEKPYISDLKNIYQEGLSDILIEDREIYHHVYSFLQEKQPEDLKKLQFYQDKQLSLSKLYSIETVIQNGLKERVWMKSGAYLVIQPTEALTVIDVNTGKHIGKKKDDIAYMKINMEAAKEVAKQIRLRNLSGIILIDFINLDNKEKWEELLNYFNGYLRKDPIQTVLVDVTKLQLVEITRKKVRKPLSESIKGDSYGEKRG
ncbi:ribonuclease E/G [Faecalimonas sp.]